MLVNLTIGIIIFAVGWFEAINFKDGATLTVLARQLNFDDISLALRMVTVGLIVANIAVLGEHLKNKKWNLEKRALKWVGKDKEVIRKLERK